MITVVFDTSGIFAVHDMKSLKYHMDGVKNSIVTQGMDLVYFV